ncbi:hypothetical protein M9Y10_020454 [Tritrichomonas musculus]|uniref:DUF3447 domain-containing protein n=1 Tax=Tritrichomonas musculus TaxID=1915356 RepID=A0ABR2HH60_9EUKA
MRENNDIVEFINEKKEMYDVLLDYLENGDSNLDFLLNTMNVHFFLEDKDELNEFIRLLFKISNHHQRQPDLFAKIKQILDIISNSIKKTYSNIDIFKIFCKNKLFLLYLIEKNVISIDNTIVNLIMEKSEPNSSKFCHFFYPEIEFFINEEKRKEIKKELLNIDPQIFTNFESNRQKGENDSYICKLIRNDLIDDFISHVTRTNLSLSSKIKSSLFETNNFLIKNESSLIEYAAFFGSIQIFRYLQLSHVKMTPSLWLYAIHGRNAELIHLLEENQVELDDKTYEKYLKESIKCHHNDIASYFLNNFANETEEQLNDDFEFTFKNNVVAYAFQYRNYSFIDKEINHIYVFFYSCLFNLFPLVKLFLKTKDVSYNYKIISNSFSF